MMAGVEEIRRRLSLSLKYSRLFATPEGRELLREIRETHPDFHAYVLSHLEACRGAWKTGQA